MDEQAQQVTVLTVSVRAGSGPPESRFRSCSAPSQAAGSESTLHIYPWQPLRFNMGNPLPLQQLRDALWLTAMQRRRDFVPPAHGDIELKAPSTLPGADAATPEQVLDHRAEVTLFSPVVAVDETREAGSRRIRC